jgi:hypothetical protein
LKKIHKIILTLFSVGLILFVGWIIRESSSYLFTDQLMRPHHPNHKLWKPGGVIGHGLGIIGGSMMIIMFVYSLRKRIKFFRNWGNLPTWLNYHIFFGIAGPILVTFHTALKFGGLVSISYWSMIAVALSGFIGRYIYIKIPHHVNGKEVTRDDFNLKLNEITVKFKKNYKLSDETIGIIYNLSGGKQIEKKGLWGVFTLFFIDLTGWFRRKQIISAIQDTTKISKSELKEFQFSLMQIIKMNRQIAFWNTAQKLFHYWHVIHKPFAYTMLVIMFIHITVAVSLGYTWIY